MLVLTKKYGNDPIRAYKGLQRKLSREGFYEELRNKEAFKSKSQKKREDKQRNTARVNKQRLKTKKLLAANDNKKVGSSKQKN